MRKPESDLVAKVLKQCEGCRKFLFCNPKVLGCKKKVEAEEEGKEK